MAGNPYPDQAPAPGGPPKPKTTLLGCGGAVLLALAVLLGGLALVTVAALSQSGQAPTCNGETMSPGDQCITIDGDGESESQTYEEIRAGLAEGQRTSRRVQPYLLAGTAVFLIAGIALLVARSGRIKAARRAGPPLAGPPR